MRWQISLFWRTFFLLVLLLVLSGAVWLQAWLLLDPARLCPAGKRTLLVWLLSAVLLSLLAAAWLTRHINRPLKRLSDAVRSVRDGDFAAIPPLNEQANTAEIREVNTAFNRMTQALTQWEQERAIMLAGISHDLRTPLARLRLETEMSVEDAHAHRHMCADIAQLEATIDKFLDYARPLRPSGRMALRPVALHHTIATCARTLQEHDDFELALTVPEDVQVLADALELARAITNLLENALRYGKTPGTDTARVHVSAVVEAAHVTCLVRDHGAGAPPECLERLVQPFFRGDAARTAAVGAGLGLSIVQTTVQRMGGALSLSNAAGGGLLVCVQLQRANPEKS